MPVPLIHVVSDERWPAAGPEGVALGVRGRRSTEHETGGGRSESRLRSRRRTQRERRRGSLMSCLRSAVGLLLLYVVAEPVLFTSTGSGSRPTSTARRSRRRSPRGRSEDRRRSTSATRTPRYLPRGFSPPRTASPAAGPLRREHGRAATRGEHRHESQKDLDRLRRYTIVLGKHDVQAEAELRVPATRPVLPEIVRRTAWNCSSSGPRREGLSDWLHGSTMNELRHRLNISVLVAGREGNRPREHLPLQTRKMFPRTTPTTAEHPYPVTIEVVVHRRAAREGYEVKRKNVLYTLALVVLIGTVADLAFASGPWVGARTSRFFRSPQTGQDVEQPNTGRDREPMETKTCRNGQRVVRAALDPNGDKPTVETQGAASAPTSTSVRHPGDERDDAENGGAKMRIAPGAVCIPDTINEGTSRGGAPVSE